MFRFIDIIAQVVCRIMYGAIVNARGHYESMKEEAPWTGAVTFFISNAVGLITVFYIVGNGYIMLLTGSHLPWAWMMDGLTLLVISVIPASLEAGFRNTHPE